MFSQPSTRSRLLTLGALLIVLATCGIVYGSQNNAFAPVSRASSSATSTFTNPEILQNWLPADSYTYTVARIHDYLRTNNILATSMTVKSAITFNTPTYDFTTSLAPQGQVLNVVVTITNDSAILSTTVTINGQEQDPIVPTGQNSLLGSTSYTGFDALINNGLTAIQSNELQQALQTFAPAANSIAIDATSVQLESVASDGITQPFTFTISIDGKDYSATLHAIGLLRIQFYLYDASSNRQVFDSGVISQGS